MSARRIVPNVTRRRNSPRSKRDWRAVLAQRSERNARAGRVGAMAQQALYGRAQLRAWGQEGGRPRDPVLAEIRGEVGL